MPYICVNLTKKLSDQQKDAIKSSLGEKISLIPGKTEKALMVDFSEGHTMYFAGEKRDLAFVDVRCYKTAAFEDKKKFTEAVFELLEKETGLTADDIYLSWGEYDTWGTKGSMK